jgi:catechol 2,3-dioxygenase-like lactoylglutathione lyase family enzyme
MAQTAQGKAVKFEGIVPILLVNDVVRSAHWYRDTLGFTLYGFWGDPPCFSIVGRGPVEVFLKGPESPGQEVPVRPDLLPLFRAEGYMIFA